MQCPKKYQLLDHNSLRLWRDLILRYSYHHHHLGHGHYHHVTGESDDHDAGGHGHWVHGHDRQTWAWIDQGTQDFYWKNWVKCVCLYRKRKKVLWKDKIFRMIKCRDLRGALMTDIEMRDLLEKNISNHEVVLTDLESRQVNMKYFWNLSDYIKLFKAFALLCLHAEGKIVTKFVSIFQNIFKTFSEIETRYSQQQLQAWNNISSLLWKIFFWCNCF